MRLLVTGGAGRLARDFARAGQQAGHQVRIMSRRPRTPESDSDWAVADLATGTGVADAVHGVEAVIHAASDPTNSSDAAVSGTRFLAERAQAAGVKHLIYVSIVGIDRIPLSYYRRKLAAEGAVARTGIPFSTLRATQFHYFVDLLLRQAARLPAVLPLPTGFKVQSVATEDVSDRLLEIPGRVGKAFRAGYNTVPTVPCGTLTWAAWLRRASDGSS
jgi:uncharacterized protein YbjT (DUF2867 family)